MYLAAAADCYYTADTERAKTKDTQLVYLSCEIFVESKKTINTPAASQTFLTCGILGTSFTLLIVLNSDLNKIQISG